MNKDKWRRILFFIAGALFIVAGIIHKSYVFIPIGCCYLILGTIKDGKEK